MEVPTVFRGELRFVSYTDSSRSGPRLTFSLAERDGIQQFIGLEGKVLMAVMVLVGDDGRPAMPPGAPAPTPAPPPPEPGPPPPPAEPKGGSLARLAGMWCANDTFQDWLFGAYPGASAVATERAKSDRPDLVAAEVVRFLCKVDSRAKLDHEEHAAKLFQERIRGPYMRHLGQETD